MLCLSGVLAGTVLRSAGPAWVILAGGMNVVTANWTAPLLLVLALTVMFCVGGLTAARLAERSR